MVEEKPMLQNQNPSKPTTTSLKNPLIKSDITTIASTPQKRDTTIVAERFEAEEGKGEEKSMSSSLHRGGLKEESGRERLKRHRVEVAGQVWIPDTWGQEHLLKDWIDCSAFDSVLVPTEIKSARTGLAEEARRAHSASLGVENSC